MKPSTAKTKGRETENAFVAFLRSHGIEHAERRRLMAEITELEGAGEGGAA